MGDYAVLVLIAIAAVWTLVRIALAMCRLSGHFSEQEEIEQAKRKWGKA